LNSNNKTVIDYLPNGIEELVLGYSFNLELNDLPSSIKKIVFKNNNYKKKLNCLPTNIELIELPEYYKLKIENIPKRLKKIICDKDYKFVDDYSNIEVEYY